MHCINIAYIPPELIINYEQTGTKYVPTSEWTLAEEGSKQVIVIGKEDKRDDCSLVMQNTVQST